MGTQISDFFCVIQPLELGYRCLCIKNMNASSKIRSHSTTGADGAVQVVGDELRVLVKTF